MAYYRSVQRSGSERTRVEGELGRVDSLTGGRDREEMTLSLVLRSHVNSWPVCRLRVQNLDFSEAISRDWPLPFAPGPGWLSGLNLGVGGAIRFSR